MPDYAEAIRDLKDTVCQLQSRITKLEKESQQWQTLYQQVVASPVPTETSSQSTLTVELIKSRSVIGPEPRKEYWQIARPWAGLYWTGEAWQPRSCKMYDTLEEAKQVCEQQGWSYVILSG